MRTTLIALMALLLLLLTYRPGMDQTKNIEELELQVLREIVLADTVPTVYSKTIISDLNQPLSRHLFYLDTFDICTNLVEMDSMHLDREERDYLVERFSTMETAKITKLIRDPKNFVLKELSGDDWSVISLPVVFREGNYAIYYAMGPYSGQFKLLKKTDSIWTQVCLSTVWIE